jgi:very-short-patch-repair endonuclease
VVARWQLLRLGVTASQVDGWVRRGRLRFLFRGVYLVGPIVLAHSHEMAATLACGPTAALSHQSATYLYEILPYPAEPGPVEVTVTAGRHGRQKGIHLHRTTTLLTHEIRERHGIPVTSPTRTLIDVAAHLADAELEQAVAESFALRLTSRSQLLRAVDVAAGRRGVAKVRALIDGDRRPARTRSAPEHQLLMALRAASLPPPEVNARLGPWEVDFLWREHRLVVEVDGYAAHSSPWAFERDRRKGAELEQMGLSLIRVSARQVRDQPRETVARVRRALDG